MELPMPTRRYTDEEKRQLLANLDIEVAHRERQFKGWLQEKLEIFDLHQEGQISRIPKQVRSMTMRDFGGKYEGNIQTALRGFQKDRLAAAGIDATHGETDKSERKRKWVASQEVDAEASGSSQPNDTDAQRALKNARTQLTSPKKAGSSTGPGTAQRSRLATAANKTPGTSRIMGHPPTSSSPQRQRPPFNNTTTAYNPRPPSRPTSPVKYQASKPNGVHPQHARVPSTSSFNPALPPKTPAFPSKTNAAMRLPRKDENMLSVNGSPLANPYEFGLGWFKGIETQMDEDAEDDQDEDDTMNSGPPGGRTLKRSKSSIVIRRDPSVAFPATLNGMHSRTDSQASFYTASSQATSSSSHSRENSQTLPLPPSQLPATNLGAFRFPSSRPNGNEATPRPLPKHARSFSALVAIPTKDGHMLEFDPLQTSPGALDALEGISDSAKKQAKAEMGRLIQATVDKWQIR